MLKLVNRKKILSILLVLVMLGGMVNVTPIIAQVNYESYNGISVDATPILPDQEVHPKLWFDASGAEAMYDKRNADEYAAQLWDSISSSPYLTREFSQAPVCVENMSNSAVHGYYGDMARIAKYNAFMFAMEGDQIHLQRATEALKRAYDGPIYDCPQIDPLISSSPIDETYRAIWAQHYAAAYDWIQPELSLEDDKKIKDILAVKPNTL